ncbi:hypothetical protein [Corynebacterium aquilae]|uniref:hypothetical protein n=1 Tax=Corynebacterium aquilae TaxID=203263 RepID=UPI0012ED0319|nr:hypothetical protein [Corynebacterium aquilae]
MEVIVLIGRLIVGIPLLLLGLPVWSSDTPDAPLAPPFDAYRDVWNAAWDGLWSS